MNISFYHFLKKLELNLKLSPFLKECIYILLILNHVTLYYEQKKKLYIDIYTLYYKNIHYIL